MEQDNTLYYTPLNRQLLLQQQYTNASIPQTAANMTDFSNNVQPVLPLSKPKRRQVKNACVNCQKACKKCDDGRPCQRCIKHNLVDTCKNSVRKERKKGIKRGPYKRRPMSLLESQHQDSALPVLPQNHKIDQHVTPPSVVASQSDFLTFPIYSLYNDNTIPSPISNHNDIITNRPSPQRHFIHDKPLHNTMYGTPIGSPLLSNEVIPSWIADGTFQYVPQHNAHQ